MVRAILTTILSLTAPHAPSGAVAEARPAELTAPRPVERAAARAPEARLVQESALVSAEAAPGCRLGAVALERDERRPDRARRSTDSLARRTPRKRQLLAHEDSFRCTEQVDATVPVLAAELDRAASVRHRLGRAAPAVPVRLRLMAAGAVASRRHLPPPPALL